MLLWPPFVPNGKVSWKGKSEGYIESQDKIVTKTD